MRNVQYSNGTGCYAVVLKHTVLCPIIILVTEFNLNCFSFWPEYQIKNFSSCKVNGYSLAESLNV